MRQLENAFNQLGTMVVESRKDLVERLEAQTNLIIEQGKKIEQLEALIRKQSEGLDEHQKSVLQMMEGLERMADKDSTPSKSFDIALIRTSTASTTCNVLEENLSKKLNSECDLWTTTTSGFFLMRTKSRVRVPVKIKSFSAQFDMAEVKRCQFTLVVGYSSTARVESNDFDQTYADLTSNGVDFMILGLRYGDGAGTLEFKERQGEKVIPSQDVVFQSDGVIFSNSRSSKAVTEIKNRIHKIFNK